jgi:DegV family protein with EDD domain
MSVKIVTDSTCDLPQEIANQYGITVVPLYVNIGTQSYQDGVELSRREFYERLPDCQTPPTTSAPGPEQFRQVYEGLAADGATEILSIHISISLSTILNSARLAAQEIETAPVTVFDSTQLSLGTGFLVLKAAQAAAAGHSAAEIVAMLEEQASRTYVFAALDTLEFLRRSGRVNGFQSGVGNLLNIKPLLKMHGGEPASERVRTRKRALQRVIDLVNDLGPVEQLALVHTNAPEEAEGLRQQARHLFPEGQVPLSVDVTPVIGAHIGPGAVGFACVAARAKDSGQVS